MDSTIFALCEEMLPRLRRFARALAGQREPGDALVADLLQDLLDGRIDIASPDSVPVVLFRALAEKADAGAGTVGGPAVPGIAGRFGKLSSAARRALLLVLVEGFGNDEVAEILSVDWREVPGLLDEAQQEIEAQQNARILIIEDEPLIAQHLRMIVQAMGHRVVGVAATRHAAVEAAKAHAPDLLLVDVQLADLSSGIDTVDDITRIVNVPSIFITAYPDRLLTGDQDEPAFLLAKPFDPDIVRAVVSQAIFVGTN